MGLIASQTFLTFCRNSLRAGDVDPAVAYLRYMIHRMEMNKEQVLWLCFLYGVTYHLPSAYLLWSEFPDLERLDTGRLQDFWREHQREVPFQTDKMKQRPHLPETVESYRALTSEGQARFFRQLFTSDPAENFSNLWGQKVAYFGRFSIWNWAQMLKHVAGYPVAPRTLMIGEPESRSFTAGLAYAFGLDRGERTYRWSDSEKAEMERACQDLRGSLGIDNYQLETLACAYKKVWREHDSRYVGYYNDRLAEDIRRLEGAPRWCGVDWSLLWDARGACVPEAYRNGGVDKRLFRATPEEKTRRGHVSNKRPTTRSVYLIGGAGTGKSTFMSQLVPALGCTLGDFLPIFKGQEASTGRSRTLCGHALLSPGPVGVYVGQNRAWFPGSDGLDLVISPTAAEWLRAGSLPALVVSEGAVLATPKFLSALQETTNLLLVHLRAPIETVRQRVKQRGSDDRHGEEFLLRTTTRAENTRKTMQKAGTVVLSFDSSIPEEWADALDICKAHLLPEGTKS